MGYRLRLLILLPLLLLLACAEKTLTALEVEGERLFLLGTFDHGTYKAVLDTLDAHPRVRTLVFTANGGSVMTSARWSWDARYGDGAAHPSGGGRRACLGRRQPVPGGSRAHGGKQPLAGRPCLAALLAVGRPTGSLQGCDGLFPGR